MIKSQQYEQHQAINEFVDNSFQSFLDSKKKLAKLRQNHVEITIEFHKNDEDPSREFISITDDAGGIPDNKFDHAFELANPEAYKHPNSLNEFGVGMKQAALWFGNHFTVVTSAIGEDYETTVDFNLKEIEEKKEEVLSGEQVKEAKAKKNDHYTKVIIKDMNRMPPAGARVIKEHLEDTYRKQLRTGQIKLTIKTNNQLKELKFEEPEILNKPYWSDDVAPYDGKRKKKDGTFIDPPENFENRAMLWRKEFDFEMPPPMDYAKGFIALNSTMQRGKSGLVIFRRGRGVLGTGKADDANAKYRPKKIFGATNNQRYARVIGEIEVGPNSPVTNSKKLDWTTEDGLEEIFINKLNEIISGDPRAYEQCLIDNEPNEVLEEYLPLKRMADKYRKEYDEGKKLSSTKKVSQARSAVGETTKIIERGDLSKDAEWAKAKRKHENSVKTNTLKSLDPKAKLLAEETVTLKYGGIIRKVTVRVENEPKSDWYKFASNPKSNDIGVSLNMDHPFSKRFIIDDNGYVMNSLVRVVAGLAFAEVLAEETNNKDKTSILREIFNELITGSLSKK